MTETQQLLIDEVKTHVTALLTNKLSKNIRFHTLQHTQEVVAACEKLAETNQLADDDRFALILAAWFHDTGYTGGEAKDHETLSTRLASDFLTAHDATEELKNKVAACINATRIPHNPHSLIEEIICDADLFHLGTDDFKEKNRLLREEFKEFSGKDISKKDWRKLNIRFLEGHNYFTAYAREKLEPVKQQHLAVLKEKVNDKTPVEMKPDKKENDKDKTPVDMKPDKKDKDKGKQKDKLVISDKKAAEDKAKKDKEKQSERGVATVFRIMAQNQNNLSGMADSKANILISVNSIIMSIILSSFATALGKNPNLLIPVILLLAVCVSAIILSILATRPNVTHGTFTEEDIRTKKTNLLFFGNFYKMGLKDYDWAIQEMLADKDYLYSSITKDNYFLGVVLARKYKFLRHAYNIFMYGLIISMLAFAIAIMIPEATDVYQPG